MKIRIIKTRQLKRTQLRALTALIDRCNHNDDTHYGFPFDADCYYLLYEREELAAAAALFLMGEQLDGKYIYEIAAFTTPVYRRRQHLNRLLAAMRPKLDSAYARYAVYDNADAAAALNARHAVHSHDELMLKADLDSIDRYHDTDTAADDVADVTSLTYNASGCKEGCADVLHTHENHPDHRHIASIEKENASGSIKVDYESGHAYSKYSECYFRIDNTGSNAYVFGVQTYANRLRQGHAYALLSELFRALREHGVSSASLQVSSENTPALKLYQKLGMRQSEKISLYYEQF